MFNIVDKLNTFFDSFSPSLSSNLRENRLERMSLLLEKLNHPEKEVKMIHIAGSKGKGTTSSMMAWILHSMGYKTGLYLSPHVFDIRERFTMATVFFSDELYESTLNELKSALSSFSLPSTLGPDKPTTFELYTAYAYLLFRNAGCEYGVIETGLGGRLDATNTIEPIATCFTRIEKEHTNILGSTLSQIAKEKAGIMRDGVPSFTMAQDNEAYSVLISEGERINSPLSLILSSENDYTKDKDGIVREVKIKDGQSNIRFISYFGYTDVEIIDLSFAAKVLLSLSLLDGKRCPKVDFSTSFALPGRFQRYRAKICDKNLAFVFDGAHTSESVDHLLVNLNTFSCSPLSVLIFSTAHDKDYKTMADKLVPLFSAVIITSLGKEKKSNPEEIFFYIKEKYPDKNVILYMDHGKALLKAIRLTHNGGTIVTTGSFYLVDKIFKDLNNIQYERN